MATGAPTASTSVSPASSTNVTTWMSGLTGGRSAGTHCRRDLSAADTNSTAGSSLENVDDRSVNLVSLGKVDAIHFIIELVGSYKPVAEFVALYKYKQPSSFTKSDQEIANNVSFLSHLFSSQLCNQNTTEITMSLLENLILMCCEATQSSIISEFKASLNRIANGCMPSTGDESQPSKNERLSSHMLFLDRLLALPSSLITRIMRCIYKREIPADIAKLIALVDYNLPNAQSTVTKILHTLENLTLTDRQFARSTQTAQQQQRHGQTMSYAQAVTTSASVHESRDIEMVPTTTTASTPRIVVSGTNNLTSDISDATGSATVDDHITMRPQQDTIHLGNDEFDSDTDDDEEEEEENDVSMLDEQHFTRTIRSSESTFNSGNLVLPSQEPTSSTTLDLVFNDVIVAQADMVIGEGHSDDNVRDSWHSATGTDHEGGSVIFVHDDEDEGSAGQGGEGDNSQDEDDILEEGDDDDNDQDDAEDDEDDDENDPDDIEEGEDLEISGEDEEVAFVLSRGQGNRGNRLRRTGLTSPRRGPEASITVSVDHEPNDEDHDVDGNVNEDDDEEDDDDDDDDLVLHNDGHGVDDASFEEGDIDTYDQEDDDDRDEVTILTSDNEGIMIGSENRVLRGNNPVVAVVEDVLNLMDVPQVNMVSNVPVPMNRRDRFSVLSSDFGTNYLSGLNIVQSNYSSGNWGVLFPRYPRPVTVENTSRGLNSGGGLIPGATIYRFGLGTGSGASVFVTSGNGGRLSSSGMNLVAPVAGLSNSQQTHVPPTAILPNQHPLLQVSWPHSWRFM